MRVVLMEVSTELSHKATANETTVGGGEFHNLSGDLQFALLCSVIILSKELPLTRFRDAF